ncbi:unnamed protein product [Hymenolepis diminuta]|uniref:Uncharacterized protein n=1 Tax=Hymenolepis diminuta TaxID=6216 RepID=A0A564YYY7_HYMDI|nr:unnamed protein product [Hymenolepis diminuta]
MSKRVYRFPLSITACHNLLPRCRLIAFVPHSSFTRLSPYCDMINTFWPKQFLVLCSRTGVNCHPLVVTLTATPFYSEGLISIKVVKSV